MDGFVASVVIAALAIIALGGVYSAWRHIHLPNSSGSLAMLLATLRKKAPHIPHMRGQARPLERKPPSRTVKASTAS